MPRAEPFLNLVDGTFVVDGVSIVRADWHTHEPATRRPKDPSRKVNMEMVWLLTPEQFVCERTTSADIVAFLREAERLAEESFRSSDRAFEIRVQFTCAPDGHKFQLQHHDGDAELLQAYYEALGSAKTLPVRQDEVSILVEFSVRA